MKPFEGTDSQFMESFFHNSADAITIIGADSLILYVNPSFVSLYGLQAEDVIGQDVWKLWPENPDDFPYMANHVLTNQLVSEYETRRQTPDGRVVYVSLTISPIHDKQGKTVAYLTVGRDITDRRRNEQLQLEAEKLSAAAQMGAALAHEIRNPLTSVKGFVKFMTETSDKQDEYAEIIDVELERIEGIIKDFLTTVKPQASELQTCDIRDVIRQAVAVTAPQAQMANVEFIIDLGTKPCPVQGDGARLKQVFVNLLKNAIDAMLPGGPIEVCLQRGDDRCVLAIKDQGCGIPSHLLPQLGAPFYTTKHKGTGLGLTVCQNILQQHQGKMTFTGNDGVGTTVSVELPISVPESPPVN